ncbi:MAG: hypothetical protein AAGN66_23435 [Acidobacteriota bacterium]
MSAGHLDGAAALDQAWRGNAGAGPRAHLPRERRTPICLALVHMVGRPDLWTERGPTAEAFQHLAGRRRPDSEEALMLQLSWDLWAGGDGVRLRDLLQLDPDKLRAIGDLLTAIADSASPSADPSAPIERWTRSQLAENQ